MSVSASAVWIKNQMKTAEKPPLTRAITKFVSNATVICEETEQVVLNDGSVYI